MFGVSPPCRSELLGSVQSQREASCGNASMNEVHLSLTGLHSLPRLALFNDDAVQDAFLEEALTMIRAILQLLVAI
ncbi:unnamed protein product [Protopolystoma xenopodis]|uniref:Uncharacterized protein n=1 Tax=Protopolystoma xenopodis TaxID=117903 RepID=A0A3S5BSS7_9PLAT|nr:unnamed protein product [Protopolystoma xenopodis]